MSFKQKIYLFSAFLFVVVAYFSQGFNQFDEHTQVLEFGAYKLGMVEEKNLSWEFASQMRPAIQPLMVFCTHKLVAVFGVESPFTIAFILRLFTAFISFISIHLLIKAFYNDIKGENLKKSFILLSFFLWFGVFHSVRFSSENMAGRIFVIAFALFFIWKDKAAKHYFAMGILLGFSFLFRYQNAFMIVGWMAWLLFINKSKINELLLSVLGILLVFVFGILIDRWFYGEWVLSTWKYFEENILLNKAAGFGVHPWYTYFVEIFNVGIPPFSLVFILPLILLSVFRWKEALVWTVVPFFLVHCYIGHKELRFLYPALGLLPLMIVRSGEWFNEKWPALFQSKVSKILVLIFWIQNTIFLFIISFKNADAEVGLFEKVYNDYTMPTKMYYVRYNPYFRGMPVYYYRRNNFKLDSISSLHEINLSKDTVVLFATQDKNDQAILEKNNAVVYSAFPEWVKHFNVAGWVDRTRFWKVYELKNIPK